MSTPKSATFRHDESHGLLPSQDGAVGSSSVSHKPSPGDYRHWDHLIRALSHDMSANFMVLENSFSQLSKSIGICPTEELLEQAAHVSACLSESRRYLDDLVNLAKTGTVDMEPELVDLRQTIEEVIYAQGDSIRSRGVALSIKGKLPTLWCNRKRVKQILTNLIRNAIHYGCDPERPVITVSARPQSQTLTCLKVHDNGPGIPEAGQVDIFTPGVRLPNATADGSGMGLAIVRRIAEHYGGAAELESSPGEGTTFLIHLPIPPMVEKKTGPKSPKHLKTQKEMHR